MFKYFIIIFIFFFSYSFACECESHFVSDEEREKILEKQILEADKIYIGYLISSDIVNSELFLLPKLTKEIVKGRLPYVESNFFVREVIKGKPEKVEKVTTGLEHGDCVIAMTISRMYVIVVKKGENKINICGASRRLDGNKYLDKIKNIVKKQNEKTILK